MPKDFEISHRVGPQDMPAVARLTRDLAQAASSMTVDEIRFVVKAYYSLQRDRIATANQLRESREHEEPHAVLRWLFDQDRVLEQQVRRALDKWTDEDPMGSWAKSIVGIGPVIAAGLAAHIDIRKARTAGAIWRFAGLDPTVEWGKGQKRPWNAELKVLCWKIGESFVKVAGREGDVYGQLYQQRKAIEIARNERLEFQEQAAAALEKKRFKKGTPAREIREKGMLPPAQIHERAKRWAVKIFLSHWHAEAYRRVLGKEPPVPFAIEHLGHVHEIEPPPHLEAAG